MRAVFLDRDGVINENRTDHVKSWQEFTFVPGALTALRLLHEARIPVFVVTNQAIIERGLVAASTLDAIHQTMRQQIIEAGGYIHDLRHCPHDARSDCQCRKPRPGMLHDLASCWGVNLSQSFMVGDAWTDIAAGRLAGCRCALVQTGRGAAQALLPESQVFPADFIASDLLNAVQWVMCQHSVATTPREWRFSERGQTPRTPVSIA